MKTMTAISALVVALFLTAGCGKSDRPATNASADLAIKAPVETVAAAPVNETYEAVGTVQPRRASLLATRVMGNVTAVYVNPGDEVKTGQVLLQISDTDVAAQVTKAKAALAEAEDALKEADWAVKASESARDSASTAKELATANFKRDGTLLEKRVISQLEFDQTSAIYKTALSEADRSGQMLEAAQSKRKQVLSRIEQAKAEISNVESQLIYTRIVSPIDGIVTIRSVDPGTFVSPGAPLLRIEEQHYRLEAGVEESRVNGMRLGDEAAVTVDATGGAQLTGKIGEIVPASDPNNRTFIVKLDLPANASLRSGMFGRAAFTTGKRKAIVLPPGAVFERGQLLCVYVVDENRIAHLRLVRTGGAHDGRIEVLSGLNDGECVVVADTDRVHEGAQISQ